MKPYYVEKSELTYKGKIIDVKVDTLIMPDGKRAFREVVIRGGAAAILPVLPNKDILLVRQHRHPAGELTLEMPAGTLEKDEDPYVCAMRELEEETGYKCSELLHLTSMYSTIGFCTEILHLYAAENLMAGTQHFDEDEFIELEQYTLDEALQMVYDGKIIDAKTITALFMYKERLSRK